MLELTLNQPMEFHLCLSGSFVLGMVVYFGIQALRDDKVQAGLAGEPSDRKNAPDVDAGAPATRTAGDYTTPATTPPATELVGMNGYLNG